MTNQIKKPYNCRVCELEEIPHEYWICSICGWEDDPYQNEDPDYNDGAANNLTLNQYRLIWLNYRDKIINYDNGGRKSHLVERLFKEQK